MKTFFKRKTTIHDTILHRLYRISNNLITFKSKLNLKNQTANEYK